MKYKERDFVTWIEIPVRVYFDYQPDEKMTNTYPGCPASIEINDVDFEEHPNPNLINWQDIQDWILKKYGEDLVDEAWEHLG